MPLNPDFGLPSALVHEPNQCDHKDAETERAGGVSVPAHGERAECPAIVTAPTASGASPGPLAERAVGVERDPAREHRLPPSYQQELVARV